MFWNYHSDTTVEHISCSVNEMSNFVPVGKLVQIFFGILKHKIYNYFSGINTSILLQWTKYNHHGQPPIQRLQNWFLLNIVETIDAFIRHIILAICHFFLQPIY